MSDKLTKKLHVIFNKEFDTCNYKNDKNINPKTKASATNFTHVLPTQPCHLKPLLPKPIRLTGKVTKTECLDTIE